MTMTPSKLAMAPFVSVDNMMKLVHSIGLEQFLRDLATDFLRQGLGLAAPKLPTELPPDSPIQINENGFPVFRGGDNAPARHMTVDQLLQLEQDALYSEDMQRAGISV